MKGLKTAGIRNIQKIDKEMGDGTATRKMLDNLGQVGAGLARVAGRTALGTAQSVAAAPGALKMAAKQRKDDVESGVSRRLGSRLRLRKDDPKTKESRDERARKQGIRQRALSIKKAGEKKRERQETEKLNNRQKIRDRIEAARKDNADRRKNLQSLNVRQKGGALAIRPNQRINTNQNVPSPPKALLPGTTRGYAQRPTGRGRVDVASSGGIRSKGGTIGRDGSQGRSLPARAQGFQKIRTDMNVPYSKPSSPKGRVDVASSGGIRSKGGAMGREGSQGRTLSSAKTRAAREDGLAKAASSRRAAGSPDKPDAQRARRDPEYRRKLIQQREEFIYEVENMKKDKVDKVIDIMRGKNKIEVNPKISESHLLVQDLADYKPLEFETVDIIKPKPLKASDWRSEIEESAAWTRKEGKNKSGGLNEKGRKSYERENPGSDLKAPSKKVGNKRRSSFCARMKGMKKKLTSKKTANDPNSRINKSLRAWNC